MKKSTAELAYAVEMLTSITDRLKDELDVADRLARYNGDYEATHHTIEGLVPDAQKIIALALRIEPVSQIGVSDEFKRLRDEALVAEVDYQP